MIRAVFLDIDGTLISTGTHRPAPGTNRALLAAKENGILLFPATGRHLTVPEEGYVLDLLPDCFDGFVALTGHYCCTRDGTVLLKQPLHPEDVRTVKELAIRHGIPYTYTYEKELFINLVNERVRQHNKSIGLPIPTVREMDCEREVFSITLYVDEKTEREILRPALRHSETISWISGITDVCGKDGGKKAGIRAVMRHFGLKPEEIMAVGDSNNDLSMMEVAGTAVALGNGTREIKEAADYVAASCEEDGILDAFTHFHLI